MEEIKPERTDYLARVGNLFHEAIERIKDKRLLNGLDKDRISTAILTDLIVSHKSWPVMREYLINLTNEEIKKLLPTERMEFEEELKKKS